jgi:hypothetical protein
MLQNHEPKTIPYRHIVDTSLVNEPVQACPVCGDPWIHLRDVHVKQNHTLTLCHRDEADVLHRRKGSDHRGSNVTIRFVGECQHTFSYTWQFHKGTTYLTLHDVGILPQGHWPAELWRD